MSYIKMKMYCILFIRKSLLDSEPICFVRVLARILSSWDILKKNRRERKQLRGRRCGLVVQRANSLTGGRAFDPEPRQPLFHSRDWCFTPLPGSGWQVLFDSQHGSICSEKSDTLQKLVAGQPESDPQKKETIEGVHLSQGVRQLPCSWSDCTNVVRACTRSCKHLVCLLASFKVNVRNPPQELYIGSLTFNLSKMQCSLKCWKIKY